MNSVENKCELEG